MHRSQLQQQQHQQNPLHQQMLRYQVLAQQLTLALQPPWLTSPQLLRQGQQDLFLRT